MFVDDEVVHHCKSSCRRGFAGLQIRGALSLHALLSRGDKITMVFNDSMFNR